MLVYKFYQALQHITRPIVSHKDYLISICNRIIDGLNSDTAAPFCCRYPQYAGQHDLVSTYQHKEMPIILHIAYQANDEVKSMMNLTHMSVGQGFIANVPDCALS